MRTTVLADTAGPTKTRHDATQADEEQGAAFADVPVAIKHVTEMQHMVRDKHSLLARARSEPFMVM